MGSVPGGLGYLSAVRSCYEVVCSRSDRFWSALEAEISKYENLRFSSIFVHCCQKSCFWPELGFLRLCPTLADLWGAGRPARNGRGRWQETTRCYQLKRIFLLKQKQIRFHHFVLTAVIEKSLFETVRCKAVKRSSQLGELKLIGDLLTIEGRCAGLLPAAGSRLRSTVDRMSASARG